MAASGSDRVSVWLTLGMTASAIATLIGAVAGMMVLTLRVTGVVFVTLKWVTAAMAVIFILLALATAARRHWLRD